ncbi:MAG: hypothetical protein OEW56_07915, partial [Gemmatimonadota bacterium]|nr:hypothetical protein [Gemmatimonadota bacterium]
MLRWWLAVVVLLNAPGAAFSQIAPAGDTLAVDLATARRIGLASRPQVLAARARLDAARGDRRQAG